MGSTRIRVFTGSRRPGGGLRAMPISRSGRATSCQSTLRSGVWKTGQPGGNFFVENLVGTDDVIYRKSLTPSGHIAWQDIPLYEKGLFIQGRTAVGAW
jgi:hypothetical protein